MITNIEHYFTKGCGRCPRFESANCSARIWNDGLIALRKICLDAGLIETVKWGHPCYMHSDRNIAIIGAFRDNFRLSFFNSSLMQDPHGLLEKQGANSAHADMFRFEGLTDVRERATTIAEYLHEAMSYAHKGIKPKPSEATQVIPEELADALDADPLLAEAFAELTPGRQRGYFLHIGGAKKSATRVARIEKCRSRIFDGIGFNELPKTR